MMPFPIEGAEWSWRVSGKIRQQYVTFGHLGPPSLPIDVHHLSPSGFKTLVVNRDDGIVDRGVSFWAGALDTWSLCFCWTDAVQTRKQKIKSHQKGGLVSGQCMPKHKAKREVVSTPQLRPRNSRVLRFVILIFHMWQVGNSVSPAGKKSLFQSPEY